MDNKDFEKIISSYIKKGFDEGSLTVVFPREAGKMRAAQELAEKIDSSISIAEFSDGKGRSKWGVLVAKGDEEETKDDSNM